MADVLHSSLTGPDLHECKGAASAALGQVPVATGAGTAVFGNLDYSYLSGKPAVPTVYYAGASVASPIVQSFITVSNSGGVWTAALSGISNIHHVQVQAVNAGNTLATSAIATLSTATTSTLSGLALVFNSSGVPAPTTGITIHVQVWGT